MAASRAKIFWVGLIPKSTPFTIRGLVCKPPCSPVSKVQACASCATLLRLICVSGE